MWELPHNKHWEIPPRNESDREARRAQFPQVEPEHWGEAYWRKRVSTRKKLLERTRMQDHSDDHQLETYKAHSPVRFISIILCGDWNLTEIIPPAVNMERIANDNEHMLRMLAAGAQGDDNTAGSVGNRSGDTAADQWGNPLNGWGNQQSTDTWSDQESCREIQWLRGETVQRYVHREGSDHHCFIWRRQKSTEIGYPWHRELGWEAQWGI